MTHKETSRKETELPAEAQYSVGYNFDPKLLQGLVSLNESSRSPFPVYEVYGAIREAPVPSARPQSRVPSIEWTDFEGHVRAVRDAGLSFNFLMNAPWTMEAVQRDRLSEYVRRLAGAGVDTLTVENSDIATFLKELDLSLHVSISITAGVRTAEHLLRVERAGADSLYLDNVWANRDFETLRELRGKATMPLHLYANVSCLSQCPAKTEHYELFACEPSDSMERRNRAFYLWCTAARLLNPMEWIQMPWIRPEDIGVYLSEGFQRFKLADRLTPTDVLLDIVNSYIEGKSPPDLFPLFERDGMKFRWLRTIIPEWAADSSRPISVDAKRIPGDFIDHFRTGECTGLHPPCEICRKVANDAFSVAPGIVEALAKGPFPLLDDVPSGLTERLGPAKALFFSASGTTPRRTDWCDLGNRFSVIFPDKMWGDTLHDVFRSDAQADLLEVGFVGFSDITRRTKSDFPAGQEATQVTARKVIAHALDLEKLGHKIPILLMPITLAFRFANHSDVEQDERLKVLAPALQSRDDVFLFRKRTAQPPSIVPDSTKHIRFEWKGEKLTTTCLGEIFKRIVLDNSGDPIFNQVNFGSAWYTLDLGPRVRGQEALGRIVAGPELKKYWHNPKWLAAVNLNAWICTFLGIDYLVRGVWCAPEALWEKHAEEYKFFCRQYSEMGARWREDVHGRCKTAHAACIGAQIPSPIQSPVVTSRGASGVAELATALGATERFLELAAPSGDWCDEETPTRFDFVAAECVELLATVLCGTTEALRTQGDELRSRLKWALAAKMVQKIPKKRRNEWASERVHELLLPAVESLLGPKWRRQWYNLSLSRSELVNRLSTDLKKLLDADAGLAEVPSLEPDELRHAVDEMIGFSLELWEPQQ